MKNYCWWAKTSFLLIIFNFHKTWVQTQLILIQNCSPIIAHKHRKYLILMTSSLDCRLFTPNAKGWSIGRKILGRNSKFLNYESQTNFHSNNNFLQILQILIDARRAEQENMKEFLWENWKHLLMTYCKIN